MAANTVSVQEILFKVARDAGESVAEFVTSASSTTVFVARGLLRDPHVTYKTALARIEGKGIRAVTAWNPAAEQLTVASGFTTAVAENDQVEIVGWDATRRRMMFDAVNQAIRQTWSRYGREARADLSIVLSADDATYDLPATVGELWRVGFLDEAGAYDWRAERDLWRVGGEAGAYTIQFLDNGASFLPAAYDGKSLYGWYLENEPEVTSESDNVRLPLDYFNLASYLYLAKIGAPPAQEGQDGRLLQANWQTKLGQLKADADSAAERLKRLRPKRPLRLKYERVM